MSDLDLPYQEEAICRIAHYKGRSLVTMEMGLGKTYCALKHAARYPGSFPALIVCPSNVKYNWEKEALRFIGMRASICEGRKPPKGRHAFHMPSKLTIINYEILKYWLPFLQEVGFQLIIFDECQRLMNESALWTKAAKKLAVDVPQILGLSGTPLLNRPIELFSILNILWPDVYKSKWEFSQKFCAPRWTPWGWDHSGAMNLDQLHRELTQLGMIRYRKKDVLKDLPDKVWRTVPMELSDLSEYHEASTDFMSWLKRTAAHRVHAASKAEKLTRIGYLLQLIGKLKIRSVVEWANQFLSESDEKLILFCVHQKAAEVLRRRIDVPSVGIDQRVTGRDRQLAVDQFQHDDRVRLFVGTGAAGVGITLTAASEIGIAQLPWRPGDLTQWVDRAHRIGQKGTVFCSYLIALGTIEEDLCHLLHRKQQTLSSVLDGGETPEQIDMYGELLKVIEGTL